MRSVLITGANGFLGQHLCLYLAKEGYLVIATGKGPCRLPNQEAFIYEVMDLTDKSAVNAILDLYNPDVLIHAAALSKPDICEQNKPECMLQNVDATRYLLEASKPFRPHFIYISTDFIFGDNGPHTETAVPGPLNFYGESKWMAEKLVRESGLPYTIMRPVFIYGPVWDGLKPGFLQWVLNNLRQNKSIKVVNDQLRTPTYVTDICKGLEAIIRLDAGGDFHLAGKEILTPYEMAVQIASLAGLDTSLIEKVTAASFAEPVQRAKKGGLNSDKATAMLGFDPVPFSVGAHLTFTLTT